MAWQRGEPRVCAMTVPPSPIEEDRRRISRERATLLRERIRHTNRIRGLLFGQGITNYNPLHKKRREYLKELRTGDGRSLPAHLKAEILREIDRLELVLRQISEVEAERDEMLRPAKASSPVALLMRLKGIGAEFATVLYLEGLFRHFENRRQLAAYAGLAPSPWKWQHRPRTRYLEDRQSTSAHDNGRACLDVGEIPAGQCSQLLVPPASWLRARPDPPHLDRSARPQTAHRPVEICHPWRDPDGCCHEASLRHPGKRNRLIASSTRPDQPRWIRAGGPSQTMAARCRNTVGTHPPEPDDLQNEGLWC
jgi:transposase IS116/IS110/IS902 family protein